MPPLTIAIVAAAVGKPIACVRVCVNVNKWLGGTVHISFEPGQTDPRPACHSVVLCLAVERHKATTGRLSSWIDCPYVGQWKRERQIEDRRDGLRSRVKVCSSSRIIARQAEAINLNLTKD